MSYSVLAKRYAKAIHELGHAKEQSQEYHNQLEDFSASLASHPDSRAFFANTAVSKQSKKDLLKKVFASTKMESEIQAFLTLLIDKGRFSALSDIVKASQDLIDQGRGTTRGIIHSARALSEDSKSEYERKISKIMNKKILLENQVSPILLGGIKIEVGGWTFDDSLETHMNQLTDNILNKSY